MQKNLLIVFAKNKRYGKVKTRLAKSIGDKAAFEVYATLFRITERESCAVQNADVVVYYSNYIDEDAWVGFPKYVQTGESLGDRMKGAFLAGFEAGYENIVGIGADLPEIRAAVIEHGFERLKNHDFVFGPAVDGGYYLVGMSQSKGVYIFDDKPWSTPELFELTQVDILDKNHSFSVLQTLNDIDTVEDLEKSEIAADFLYEIRNTREK